MNKVIYYFSGTGNSLRAARIIAQKIGGAKLFSIRRIPRRRKRRKYPAMSPVSKWLYPKMMTPFLNIQQEYDKGFYTSDVCIGCEVCRKICPCKNITFLGKRPVWNHTCEGCNACVAYCPTKAVQFQAPDAYIRLNNMITRRLGLPEKRTRYHNPYVTAADLIKNAESIA